MTEDEIFNAIFGKLKKMRADGLTYAEMGKITGYDDARMCQLVNGGNPAKVGGIRLRSVIRLCPELFGIGTGDSPDHFHAFANSEKQARLLQKIAQLDIDADAMGKVMKAIVEEG